MPDPPAAPQARDFVPPSSDQAAYGRHDAAEGNVYAHGHGHAHAHGGYATPAPALLQGSPLIYPPERRRQPQQQQQQQQQQQHAARVPFPGYYSLDPYAQAVWEWTQPADSTQPPTPYDAQAEPIQELRDRIQDLCHGTTPTTEPNDPLLVHPLAPQPRPLPHTPAGVPKMKRKPAAEHERHNAQKPSKRRAVSRTSSTTSHSPAPTLPADARPSPMAPVAKATQQGTGPQGREVDMDVSDARRIAESTGSDDLLPAARVFPVQIGSTLFRLSGASLCSDAPSYFSHFFSDQLHTGTDVRTLYIDRDPDTFRDIARHLQGYHVVPRDGEHFVKLFADAQFYSLPRLTKQLFQSDIFISIGTTAFRIPRDSFSAPGNSPNYFSLGFAQWFSTPAEVFPGLDRGALLRPPSIRPPSVPHRSGHVFAELMKMLQGYELDIRSETHRAHLLRDARYFHLKGLEQQLIACETSWNLRRGCHDILIRLEDIRQSGVAFLPDPPADPEADERTGRSVTNGRTLTNGRTAKYGGHEGHTLAGTVTYARPYTDDASANYHLVLETSSTELATLHLQPSSSDALGARVSFHGDTLRRITALLGVVATKMGLPAAQSLAESPTRLRVNADCALTLDGRERDVADVFARESTNPHVHLVVRRAHWRIRVEPAADEKLAAVLEPAKMQLYSTERARNAARPFLNP